MRKFKSSKDVLATSGESNFPESKTVPDLAPTMRELLVRHAQGITDNVSMNVSYSGDLPDLRGVEPHELNSMIFEAQENYRQLQLYQEELAIKTREEQYAQKRLYDLELLSQLKDQESNG